MLALIALVTSIGLADSINPSTVGPALYLATGRRPTRSVLAFTAGVFAIYSLAGLVLVLGVGQAALAALPHPSRHTAHVVELGAGIAALILAAVLWIVRERVAGRVAEREAETLRSSALLGAAITALELPTALPYFGVAAAIVGSGRDAGTQLVLLLLFNCAFVVPLLAIAGVRTLSGAGGERTLATVRLWLDEHAAILVPALVLVIALVLLTIGLVGLARG